jgi:N6-adenosine-specific RNA methylase IME4
MFSNNKFNLDYCTMSNPEIMNIPVEVLSKKGFCFLWILNSQMNVGYECMNKWGYDVIDHLTWIKTKNKKIHISHGFYFLHSSETCLVGYKCPPQETVDFRSKISNNLLVAEIRKKSQKPEQIYTLIELMIPEARKIELFARNNNLRPGWLSLGN